MSLKTIGFFCATACLSLSLFAQDRNLPRRCLELKSGPGNARNSEGSFVDLKDGRILFIYTRMYTGDGDDHGPADLAARYSSDGGETWTDNYEIVVKNESKRNVIEVSLLRLQDGRIALFYLRDNTDFDELPYIRYSSDEGKSWSEPKVCIPASEPVGYYVLNNDRVIQLKNGRLVMPLARHSVKGDTESDWAGEIMCGLSDDAGATWRLSQSKFKIFDEDGRRVTAQEPGVVELKDGKLLMFIRASGGCQYYSYSEDGGDTWSTPVRSPLKSPLSPASIKRLPNGDLLCVWNDHEHMPAGIGDIRVPLTTAISKDEGRTWQNAKNLEGSPYGWFCYTAIHVMEDSVLLAYCYQGLADSRITKVPISWLYEPEGEHVTFINRYEELPLGDFTELDTADGHWSAAEGMARVHSEAWGKGIWVCGKNAVEHSIELQLAEGKSLGDMQFAIERFSSQSPYALVIEALQNDKWIIVWTQTNATRVCYHAFVDFAFPNMKPSRIRFRAIGSNGFIICDSNLKLDEALHGFFND